MWKRWMDLEALAVLHPLLWKETNNCHLPWSLGGSSTLQRSFLQRSASFGIRTQLREGLASEDVTETVSPGRHEEAVAFIRAPGSAGPAESEL